MPCAASRPSVPGQDQMPVHGRRDALPGEAVKLGGRRVAHALGPRPCEDGRGQRVLRAALRRRRQPQDLARGHAVGGNDVGQDGLAGRQRAGLVQNDRPHRPRPLQRLGVFDEDAVFRPLAHADHQGGRRRQPQRAGAGDDEDGDEAGQSQAGRMADREPKREGQDGDHQDGGDENGRDRGPPASGSGARELCACRTRAAIRARAVSAPTRVTSKTNEPRVFDGRADDEAADGLFDRQAFARDHAFVNAPTRPPRCARPRGRARRAGRAHGPPPAPAR